MLLGLECDQFDNPADFFLDKITEAEVDLKPANTLYHYNCMYAIYRILYQTIKLLSCLYNKIANFLLYQIIFITNS